MKSTDKYIFFYKDWVANFHQSEFVHHTPFGPSPEDVVCYTSEQAYQFDKARYFRDMELADLILRTQDPQTCLLLGNRVRNFDSASWDRVKNSTMRHVVREKYEGNAYLAKKLIDLVAGGKTLVEASPIDTYWGIGMGIDNPDIEDPEKWKGKNELGQILTRVAYDMAYKLKGNQ
jgi:hypothetical protein